MGRVILAGALGFLAGATLTAEYILDRTLRGADEMVKKINGDFDRLEQKAKADAARRKAMRDPVMPAPTPAGRIPPPYPPLPTK